MPYINPKNTVLNIAPEQAAVDQGWVVSETIARHDGCFAGIITAPFDLEAGLTWTIKYKVSEYTSGGVYAIAAGQNGTNRTALGEYSQDFVIAAGETNLTLKFYSDGTLGIEWLEAYPTVEEAPVTFGFNIKENRFTSYYNLPAEMMLKISNDFFCFKDGRLWRQNVNTVRNNFFGVQYTSKIRFVCNVDAEKNKLFYNLRLNSVGDWFSPDLTTPVTDQFPSGMRSRITKGNFKLVDGKLWADVLGDMNDPAFAGLTPLSVRQVNALFKGRKMQGTYLVVDLEVANTTEVKLSSVEVYYVVAERSL